MRIFLVEEILVSRNARWPCINTTDCIFINLHILFCRHLPTVAGQVTSEEVVALLALMINSPEYIKNPYQRATFVEVYMYFVLSYIFVVTRQKISDVELVFCRSCSWWVRLSKEPKPSSCGLLRITKYPSVPWCQPYVVSGQVGIY